MFRDINFSLSQILKISATTKKNKRPNNSENFSWVAKRLLSKSLFTNKWAAAVQNLRQLQILLKLHELADRSILRSLFLLQPSWGCMVRCWIQPILQLMIWSTRKIKNKMTLKCRRWEKSLAELQSRRDAPKAEAARATPADSCHADCAGLKANEKRVFRSPTKLFVIVADAQGTKPIIYGASESELLLFYAVALKRRFSAIYVCALVVSRAVRNVSRHAAYLRGCSRVCISNHMLHTKFLFYLAFCLLVGFQSESSHYSRLRASRDGDFHARASDSRPNTATRLFTRKWLLYRRRNRLYAFLPRSNARLYAREQICHCCDRTTLRFQQSSKLWKLELHDCLANHKHIGKRIDLKQIIFDCKMPIFADDYCSLLFVGKTLHLFAAFFVTFNRWNSFTRSSYRSYANFDSHTRGRRLFDVHIRRLCEFDFSSSDRLLA